MSTAQQVAGFIDAVAGALGIETRKIQRLVIDADVTGGPLRVYVKILGHQGAADVVAAEILNAGRVEIVDAPDLVVTPAGVIATAN